MRPVLSPVSPTVLQKQLQHCRFLRMSRRGNFELYLFRHRIESPLLLEIGRLRELSFRLSGSGTGKAYDLDSFDTGPYANLQLIAWDPQEKKIAGGYRLQHFTDAFDGHTQYFTASAELYNYSAEFQHRYLPYTTETGRSWIHPEYQSRAINPHSIFVLESLWEGIGLALHHLPETRFLFGKISVPRSFPAHARDLILGMLKHYFENQSGLVTAKHPLHVAPQKHGFFNGLPLQQGLAELRNTLKFHGLHIPPLISAYVKLGPDLLTFDSTINTNFGSVPDTAILVEISKIVRERRERYFGSHPGLEKVA